jgi:hypothetical protein
VIAPKAQAAIGCKRARTSQPIEFIIGLGGRHAHGTAGVSCMNLPQSRTVVGSNTDGHSSGTSSSSRPSILEPPDGTAKMYLRDEEGAGVNQGQNIPGQQAGMRQWGSAQNATQQMQRADGTATHKSEVSPNTLSELPK